MTTITTKKEAEAGITQFYKKTVQQLQGKLDKLTEMYYDVYTDESQWSDPMAAETMCAITDLETVIKEARNTLSRLERAADRKK